MSIVLRRAARGAEDELRPSVADETPEIDALAQRAWGLASEGREGRAAIDSLREAAGRRSSDLKKAAALIRFREPVAESRVAHRANRLLLAAASDGLAAPVTPDEERWFNEIESLGGVPQEVAFTRLKSLVPELEWLEQGVRSGSNDVSVDTGSSIDRDMWWDEICERITHLLGPEAESADPLLRTETAFGVARVYLGTLAGVIAGD